MRRVPLSIIWQEQAAGVGLMTWSSRYLPDGQCVLAHWPRVPRHWWNVVDLVVCDPHRIPAERLADAALRQFPGSLLVVAMRPRLGAVIRTRNGQRGVVTDKGVDVDHMAVSVYAWLMAGRPLTAVL
jgi:hypothetical protein